MLDDTDQLYRDLVLDHSKNPRNFGRPDGPTDWTHWAEGHNRDCGDRLTVYAKVEGGALSDVRFEGRGCAIDTAAASLMTEAVKGKSLAEVRDLFDRFHQAMTGPDDSRAGGGEGAVFEELGKLAALRGVRRYPVRVKCATLPWHALRAALDGGPGAATVSTEVPGARETPVAPEAAHAEAAVYRGPDSPDPPHGSGTPE